MKSKREKGEFCLCLSLLYRGARGLFASASFRNVENAIGIEV